MSDNPKISLCMSVYNGERFLAEQLDSICKQTRLPDEVIVIDDCSKDGTAQVVKSFEGRLPIQYHLNETNLGFKKSFRKAIGLCTGDLLFLCDQDDIWMPTKIEEMVKVMFADQAIRLLCCNYECLLQDGGQPMVLPNSELNDGDVVSLKKPRYLLGGFRPGCCFCISSSLASDYLKIEDDDVYHDFALWLLALSQGGAFLYQKQLIQWRRHGTNASTKTIAKDPKRNLAMIVARTATENLSIYGEVLPFAGKKWKGKIRKAGKVNQVTHSLFCKFTLGKALSLLFSNFSFFRPKATLNACVLAFRFRKTPVI